MQHKHRDHEAEETMTNDERMPRESNLIATMPPRVRESLPDETDFSLTSPRCFRPRVANRGGSRHAQTLERGASRASLM
jgi:hypothetical protein